MADNNFKNGPGGRLVKALSKATQSASDATSIEMGGQPIIIRPSARIYNEIDDPYVKKVKRDDNFIVNFKPRSIAELTQDQTTGGVKPAPIISPYPGKMLPEVVVEAAKKEPVVYDEINYLNPFEWKLGVVKQLKKANTMLGGDIERTGYDRESYSDLINRLEQTPGTIQHTIKKVPIPNIPSSFAGPANLAINAFNYVRPGVNRSAAAVGEEALDPLNWPPAGRWAKRGLILASQIANMPANAIKTLKVLGKAAPWLDKGKQLYDMANQYIEYPTKPKFLQEERSSLTPQQQEFMKKLSQYNFGNVK